MNIKYDNVYITGDTHGFEDCARTVELAQTLTEKDLLIILGDFLGCTDSEEVVKMWTNEAKCTIAFIDGNHDDFDLINSSPTEKWNKGIINRLSKNVIHLCRGEVYDINGKTYFTMGGGCSVDKERRLDKARTINKTRQMYKIPGIVKYWWEEEQPTQDEIEYAKNNLKRFNNKVDYILTHTTSLRAMKEHLQLVKEDTELNRFLDYVLENVKYELWYFAHFHDDIYYKAIKSRLIFDDICLNGEIKDYSQVISCQIIEK